MSNSPESKTNNKPGVTGIGGFFLKAKDPKFLARWYEDNLGIGFGNNLYFHFQWRNAEDPESIGSTDLGLFASDTDYFDPSKTPSMVNFRVNDLHELLKNLKSDNVQVMEKTEEYEYGKFGWILDPEGNKVELWEPVQTGFAGMDKPYFLPGGVNGLGGIFLKSKDPKELSEWYLRHLGINFNHNYTVFEWIHEDDKNRKGSTVFTFFKENSNYFSPSTSPFMINLRVENLNKLLDQLRISGVEVMEKTEEYEYGKFGWILDPEGNKIELWEPAD